MVEQTGAYKSKLTALTKAVESFEKLMQVDLFTFTEVIADGLKNGQVQKFEYCTEALWKVCKKMLLIKNGIVANSPKEVFKELFLNKYITEKECENLVDMIDDRNLLSHVYSKTGFETIYLKLPTHLTTIKKIVEVLS